MRARYQGNSIRSPTRCSTTFPDVGEIYGRGMKKNMTGKVDKLESSLKGNMIHQIPLKQS
jgi:hypothetical protein